MIYVLNHKANLVYEEIIEYLDKLNNIELKNVIFAPSACYLPYFRGLKLACQNISPFVEGAHTGDICASQFASIGVNYALIGHSERRNQDESNSDILTNKLRQAFTNDINPIYCVGELEENDNIFAFLEEELKVLLTFNNEYLKKAIIAYEPVWSIGSGKVAKNERIEQAICFIKKFFLDNLKIDIKVLYGGSVNSLNINNLKKIPNIDGFLLGSISLNIEELKQVIN